MKRRRFSLPNNQTRPLKLQKTVPIILVTSRSATTTTTTDNNNDDTSATPHVALLHEPILDHIFSFLVPSQYLYLACLVCRLWKDVGYAPRLWRLFDGWDGYKKTRSIQSIFLEPRFEQLETLKLRPWAGKHFRTTLMKVVNTPYISERITRLDLSGCGDNAQAMADMMRFIPNLHTLIMGTSGHGSAFKRLGFGLPKLRVLDCSHTEEISLYCKPKFDKLTQLTSLNLSGCILADNISYLSILTNLKYLNFKHSPRLDTGLVALAPLISLEKLILSYCPSLRDEALTVLIKLKNLHKISVSGCRALTDTALFHIAAAPHLEVVKMLEHSEHFTAVGLRQIPARVKIIGASVDLQYKG